MVCFDRLFINRTSIRERDNKNQVADTMHDWCVADTIISWHVKVDLQVSNPDDRRAKVVREVSEQAEI